MDDYRVANVSEIARYADGTTVHCGLAKGHNNGLHEDGSNHQYLYEQRLEKGELPFITQGIHVRPVVGHKRDGVDIPSYWRSEPGDIERFLEGTGNGEGEAHKLAKQACFELISEGKINRIVRGDLPKGFYLGGQKQELNVEVGEDTYFADVGVWDDRFPNAPIVFEVTNTSGQKAARLKAMSDVGIRVYEILIGSKVRTAAKNGIKVDVEFFRSMMLNSKFRLRNGASTDCALTQYIRVKEAEDAARERDRQAREERKADLDSMRHWQENHHKRYRDELADKARRSVRSAEYVRKVGPHVAANRLLHRIRDGEVRDVLKFARTPEYVAAVSEIESMDAPEDKVRAVHIRNAVQYYGDL